MIGDKERYSCFQCEEAIVVEQVDKGKVPYLFDCVMPVCQGLMKKDFNKTDAMGREAGYEFYHRPDALRNKLSIRKKQEVADATCED